MNTNSKLISKLQNKEYRDLFVAGQIKTGVPFQIRAMRDRRGWTQAQLGQKADMPQTVISRIENLGESILSIKTLLRLASAFDVALIVRFAPFSELAYWVEGKPYEVKGLSSATLAPLSYAEDLQPYGSTVKAGMIAEGILAETKVSAQDAQAQLLLQQASANTASCSLEALGTGFKWNREAPKIPAKVDIWLGGLVVSTASMGLQTEAGR